GVSWEDYEPASIAAFARWVRAHPTGVVLDVGSSTGIFSVTALCASAQASVVAFDSDLASLAAARRMCRYAGPSRLQVVQGFVGEGPREAGTRAQAAAATEARLAATGATGEAGTTKYMCMTDPQASTVTCRRLDDLLAGDPYAGRPMLVKCDVEGA